MMDLDYSIDNCFQAHPAYLRPGTMGKEREREAYARP